MGIIEARPIDQKQDESGGYHVKNRDGVTVRHLQGAYEVWRDEAERDEGRHDESNIQGRPFDTPAPFMLRVFGDKNVTTRDVSSEDEAAVHNRKERAELDGFELFPEAELRSGGVAEDFVV